MYLKNYELWKIKFRIIVDVCQIKNIIKKLQSEVFKKCYLFRQTGRGKR